MLSTNQTDASEKQQLQRSDKVNRYLNTEKCSRQYECKSEALFGGEVKFHIKRKAVRTEGFF